MTLLQPVFSEPALAPDALVRDHAQRLGHKLRQIRAAAFPPASLKDFRRLTPTETVRFLGVTDSYLRQLAPTLKGLSEYGQNPARRTYSLDDLYLLREHLEAGSRTKGKYLPRRAGVERLQLIAVANFKGGSAKTTTAANLAQYLALMGYRVLAIDLYPQASLTALMGATPETDVAASQTLYSAIRWDDQVVPTRSVIRKTCIPGLHLIPAGLQLMEFEHETPRILASRAQRGQTFVSRIAQAISAVDADYDIVVMDCPPQLGFLTLSALAAATSVLITIHTQMLDVLSMEQFLVMLSDLLAVVAKAAPGGHIAYDWFRYLITRHEPTDGPQSQMARLLRQLFPDHVLQNPTLKSTAISDAGLTSQTIYEVQRNQFTRATYDRALESVTAVNAEILSLMRLSWGRAG